MSVYLNVWCVTFCLIVFPVLSKEFEEHQWTVLLCSEGSTPSNSSCI